MHNFILEFNNQNKAKTFAISKLSQNDVNILTKVVGLGLL